MEHGIRTIILIWLLLSGVSSSYTQDYSTWGEIFDYEVGDVFHFEDWGDYYLGYGGGGYFTLINIEITNKEFSLDSNSVTYDRFVKRETNQSLPPFYIYEEYSDTVYHDELINYCISDTTYSDTLYNGRMISVFDNSQPPQLITYLYYVVGCGYAFRLYDWDIVTYWEETHYNLVYFKKGSEEWGTPQVIVGVEEQRGVIENVKAYPNPFITSTTIEYELTEPSHVQLTIYNAIGETIHVALDCMMPQGKYTFTWSPEGLSRGMYYGVLRSEKGVSVVKLIKR